MNRTVLRNQLKALGYSDRADADLNVAIDNGNFKFNAEEEWPWNKAFIPVTYSQGDWRIALDVSVKKVRAVTLDDGSKKLGKLRNLNDLLERRIVERLESGTPTHYASEDEGTVPHLYVTPTPAANGALIVFATKRTQPLANDGAEPDMPAEYHEAVYWAAAAYLASQYDDEDTVGTYAQANYDRILAYAKDQELETDDDRETVFGSQQNAAVLIQQVRRMGVDASDGVILQELNDTDDEIAGMEDWPYLMSGPVVVQSDADAFDEIGDDILALEPKFASPRRLFDVTGGQSERAYLLHYMKLDAVTARLDWSATGEPEVCSVWPRGRENVMRLWPIPEQQRTFKLFYTRKPTPMVLSSDEPEIPVTHRRLLVLGAAMRLLPTTPYVDAAQRQELRADVRLYQQEFERRLDAMRRDLLVDNNYEYDTIDVVEY